MTPEVLIIIGSFVTGALGINAYFIKGLVESLKKVEIQTATIAANSQNSAERISDIEDEIGRLRTRMHDHAAKITAHGLNIEIIKEKIN